MTIEYFEILNWAWMGVAVIVFVILLFITAPYGRHIKSNWGPLIGNRLGWILMEVIAPFVVCYFVFRGSNEQSFVNILLLSFFVFHYVNRSLIFPFRLKTQGKKIPASIVLMGVVFNIFSGFLIGYYFGNFKVYDRTWLHSFPFIAGAVIFIMGLIINWQSDTVLINLRRPGETGYKIPSGRLFNYISCPNLFGETIEWAGFAILTWSLPGFAFFIWTAANLIPRAIANHVWYRDKFPEYPKDRKAMIPFIL